MRLLSHSPCISCYDGTLTYLHPGDYLRLYFLLPTGLVFRGTLQPITTEKARRAAKKRKALGPATLLYQISNDKTSQVHRPVNLHSLAAYCKVWGLRRQTDDGRVLESSFGCWQAWPFPWRHGRCSDPGCRMFEEESLRVAGALCRPERRRVVLHGPRAHRRFKSPRARCWHLSTGGSAMLESTTAMRAQSASPPLLSGLAGKWRLDDNTLCPSRGF